MANTIMEESQVGLSVETTWGTSIVGNLMNLPVDAGDFLHRGGLDCAGVGSFPVASVVEENTRSLP